MSDECVCNATNMKINNFTTLYLCCFIIYTGNYSAEAIATTKNNIHSIHITISNHTSNLKISKSNKILKIDLHIYLVKYMNICNVRTYIVCIQWTYIFININQYKIFNTCFIYH